MSSWLKRHPKVLQVFGALIVLLTYSIKEVWRDSVRDKLQDVSNQHSSLLLALRFDATAHDMYGLNSIEPAALTETITRDRMLAAIGSLERSRFLDESDLDRLEQYSKTFGPDCTQCVNGCRNELKKMQAASFAAMEPALLGHTTVSQRTKDLYLEADRQRVNVKTAIEKLMACAGKQHSARRAQLEALLTKLSVVSSSLYCVGGLIGIASIFLATKT